MTILLWVIVLPLGTSAPARAATLHRLASGTDAFASDGVGYAAWQQPGTTSFTLLDAASGQTRQVPLPSGCVLHDEAEGEGLLPSAAAARFLLDCADERQLLWDARTGVTVALPRLPNEMSWARVGTRYVEGYGNEHRALFDIATGAVSIHSESGAVDLDTPGAGAGTVCTGLRRAVVREVTEGAESTYAYRHDMLVRRHGTGGDVQIEDCHGGARILHAAGGAVRGRGEPVDFDLRGGLLSWDTGDLAAAEADRSERRFPSRLYSYDLRTHRRMSWPLPQVTVRGATESVKGSFGHSTHAAHTVFWIATQTVTCLKVCEAATSAVYAART